jgi:hypothetical protein
MKMRRIVIAIVLMVAAAALHAAAPAAETDWREKVNEMLPLLGHRNWILIADSAYPLQVSPGIETIDTNASQAEVAHYVLRAIEGTTHVRPEIFVDAELPFVNEGDAPGASEYRRQIGDILRGYDVQSELHDKLIAQLGEAGQTFHVLVLKTNLTIPYSSVFIRLNCKYWATDAETRMRARMAAKQ